MQRAHVDGGGGGSGQERPAQGGEPPQRPEEEHRGGQRGDRKHVLRTGDHRGDHRAGEGNGQCGSRPSHLSVSQSDTI